MEQANKVDPKDTLVLMNLGKTCADLGDIAAARKWYAEIIRIDPNGEYAKPAKEALKKLDSRP